MISTVNHIFSTMPDLEMALPTRPDIGNPKCRPRNRRWKPEVEIILEGKQFAMRFQKRLPPHVRPCQTQKWHCRYGPTSEIQNVGHGTGSGKNCERKEPAMRFQRLPHICDYTRLRNGTADTARHRPTSGTQNVDQNRK